MKASRAPFVPALSARPIDSNTLYSQQMDDVIDLRADADLLPLPLLVSHGRCLSDAHSIATSTRSGHSTHQQQPSVSTTLPAFFADHAQNHVFKFVFTTIGNPPERLVGFARKLIEVTAVRSYA
jgi:hypothetical protein